MLLRCQLCYSVLFCVCWNYFVISVWFRCCYDEGGALLTSDSRNLALARGMMSSLSVDTATSNYWFEFGVAEACCHADLIRMGLTDAADCTDFLALRPGAGFADFVGMFGKRNTGVFFVSLSSTSWLYEDLRQYGCLIVCIRFTTCSMPSLTNWHFRCLAPYFSVI